jgi:anaerobic selenocysteine-containing dehydrogenase
VNLYNAWDWFHSILQNLSSTSSKPISEILTKGGVFWNKNAEYKDGPLATAGTHMAGQYAKIIRLFADPLARTRDSITGKYYLGTPERTLQTFHDGTPIDQVDAAWPYQLITFKAVDHGQARTVNNPWLMLRRHENTVDISTSDARTLGIEDGDQVRLISPSNVQGVVGKARVTEGMRPGVLGVSHHYGHWELSSKPYFVKDAAGVWTKVLGDPSRGAGINTNQISRLDTYNVNTALQDPIGGSVSFFDTRVRIEKVL